MGLSFGIYKKQTLLFLGVIILVVGFGYFIPRQFSSASINDVSQESTSGVYTMNMEIKENAQITINGKEISNLLHMGQDFDEFRYLAAEEEGIYINKLIINVALPKPASASQLKQIVYAVHGVENTAYYQLDPQTLVYEADGLSPAASFTVVAELPKGMLNFPWWDKTYYKLANLNPYIWLGISATIPLISLLILLWLYAHQLSEWRLPKIKDRINQPPSNLAPAEVEVLLFGRVSARSIAATLLDLAQRGYIYIINKDENFSFGKRKPLDLSDRNQDVNLHTFERTLLAKVFTQEKLASTKEDILMRIGRHVFSRKIAEVYVDIYGQISSRGFFVKNPSEIHKGYRLLGLILFFVSILGFAFGIWFAPEPKYILVFWFMMTITSFIIIKLAPQLPSRTASGKQELIKWLKFKNFLTDKSQFVNHTTNQELFERYLPYAISMGVEVEWSKCFLDEPFKTPDWFVSRTSTSLIEDFVGKLLPIVGFVSSNLASSKEPIVQ